LAETLAHGMSKQMLQRQVQGSTLIDNYGKFETVAALLDQSPRSLKLETLFSTRNSGWTNPAAFHTACDHKGPTLTLIQHQNGIGYGGYTSISWSPNGQWQTDTKAFLFQIANFTKKKKKQASQKFARKGNGMDIYAQSSYGPTFGAGHDLMAFNSSAEILTSSPSTYSTSGPLIPNTVSRDQHLCHMEVLLVSKDASGSAEELEAPWQTDCSWSVQVNDAFQAL